MSSLLAELDRAIHKKRTGQTKAKKTDKRKSVKRSPRVRIVHVHHYHGKKTTKRPKAKARAPKKSRNKTAHKGGKLSGAKKAEFLSRMARGRAKARKHR